MDLKKEVERQEKLTGKTFDENEVLQLRYNTVMREAAKIQGAAAASSVSAKAHSKALVGEVNGRREAIGEEFQVKAAIDAMDSAFAEDRDANS